MTTKPIPALAPPGSSIPEYALFADLLAASSPDGSWARVAEFGGALFRVVSGAWVLQTDFAYPGLANLNLSYTSTAGDVGSEVLVGSVTLPANLIPASGGVMAEVAWTPSNSGNTRAVRIKGPTGQYLVSSSATASQGNALSAGIAFARSSDNALVSRGPISGTPWGTTSAAAASVGAINASILLRLMLLHSVAGETSTLHSIRLVIRAR